jgi:hypothetical protein
MQHTFIKRPFVRITFAIIALAAPLPAWAYQVLWVNKRIGVLDPGASVPAPMSPLNAPDSPTWPDCQLRTPTSNR